VRGVLIPLNSGLVFTWPGRDAFASTLTS